MTSEALLSKRTMHLLRRRGFQAERIENKVSTGIPDIYTCRNGVSIWLELKVFKWPSRASSPVRIGLRDGQIIWAREHVAAGGDVCLLAQEAFTGAVFLFAWKKFVTADMHPFALCRDEFTARSTCYGTLPYVITMLQNYTDTRRA